MKKIIITIGIVLLGLQTMAQSIKIQLAITNEKNEPYNNATALLYRLPDSTLTKKILKANDFFSVEKQTNYFLIITATNKEKYSRTINVKDSSLKVAVVLKDAISDLSSVTIVSRKPLIKEEDDKTIVDATALTISSTNAYEVLEKTPGAIIDQDGNVYLTSTTPATIFINGREMKLSSADLSSLLKSLPANSISKIEILRNPSAKYDAASSGGILNIVLKKGVKLGSNGSVNMAYFQGIYATETAGMTFNKSTDKLNTYVSYQFTNRTNYESLNSDRRFALDSSLVRQTSFTKYPSITHYASLASDYSFNKKWNVGYDTRFTYTKNDNVANNNIEINNELTNILKSKNNSEVSNFNQSVYWSNTFNAKCKIDTAGSEWTNSIEYTRYDYNNSQEYGIFSTTPVSRNINGNGINHNIKNNLTIQSDLTLKLPRKYTLETGIKFSFNKSNNNADYFLDTGNNINIVDPFQTNKYQYNENINAAYLQVSKTFWGFTLKPGFRFETTDINGRQIIPSDTSFSIKRNDIFPYIFVKHPLFKMFGKVLMASAIFRKSIKRPYYESLNPYPRYIDQYLYDVGNPMLRPQLTTNFEGNVTYNDIPVAAFGMNQTKDIFTNVIYQNDITKVAYRTFDNLGNNKEFYGRLVGGIPPGGKYFFYFGCLFNYNEYNGYYQNKPFNYNRSTFTFFTFHEFKATKTFTLNMQGFMRTKALQNFYELNTFGGIFVSANKSILNKKANIILSINDLLHTNQVSFIYNQNNQSITGSRVNDTRRLGITIRYNFGIKPKEEKKPGFDTPQE